MDMIQVSGLHKSFGELKVLQGIDQVVEKGEKLVIIGPSGSGKSTFLQAASWCFLLREEERLSVLLSRL